MKDDDSLYGVVFGCPVLERMENCPFLELDHLSLHEKLEWVSILTPEQKAMFMLCHTICSRNRFELNN